MKIFILGSTGMIGHKIYHYLESRNKYNIFNISKSVLNDKTIVLDLRKFNDLEQLIIKHKPDLIINACGLLIDDSIKDPISAIKLNALLPHYLENISHINKFRLIHISTDCVFSGADGPYKVSDQTDAKSIYGKTKALGEINSKKNITIRTSVIGPDLFEDGKELFHWFMSQESKINGYTKSIWSGITTFELSRVVEKLIHTDEHGIKNLSSNNSISKFELLSMLNDIFNKGIDLNPVDGPISNKTLIRGNFFYNKDVSYEILIKEMQEDIISTALYPHYNS